MKHFLILILLFFGVAAGATAQENLLSKGFGFGFQLNQYHRDFGMGLSVTSPLMVKDHIALRLRGNLMYLDHLKGSEMTWTPYSNISLGVVSIGGHVSENIRLYGEGGMIGILPNQDFSAENVVIGGYGVFGFEFFMAESFNYFIELGGLGTGATADKIPGKPIYSNGFTISTGFRTYLK